MTLAHRRKVHSAHVYLDHSCFLPVLTSLLLSAAVTSSLSPGGSDRHDSAVGPHTRIPTRSRRVGHCACGRQPPLLIKPQILEVRSAPLSALRVRLRSSADLIRFGQPVSFPLQSNLLPPTTQLLCRFRRSTPTSAATPTRRSSPSTASTSTPQTEPPPEGRQRDATYTYIFLENHGRRSC